MYVYRYKILQQDHEDGLSFITRLLYICISHTDIIDETVRSTRRWSRNAFTLLYRASVGILDSTARSTR